MGDPEDEVRGVLAGAAQEAVGEGRGGVAAPRSARVHGSHALAPPLPACGRAIAYGSLVGGGNARAACSTSPRLRGEVDLRAEPLRSEANRVRGLVRKLRLAATPPHPDSFAALGIRPLPARGEGWRKWLCLAPQDTNSYAIVLFGIMLQVSDPAHRPRRIASKRCAKVASGFGHISSSSTGGAAGSVVIVTITGSLANGSKPVVAFTGSAPVVARTGSPVATAGAGSVLATARTGLMTRARAGAPAFSGPYQQRLPCAMRYCQWPARSDAGGKVVRHSGNAGSTEHITLHASTAADAPRGTQPSIPSRFACLWRNAFAPVGRMAAAGPRSRDK